MRPTDTLSTLPLRIKALALILWGLAAGELARLTFGIFPAGTTWTGAMSVFTQGWFVVFCLLGLPVCSIREKTLLALSGLLTMALLNQPDAYAIISSALGLAAFIGVFIAMLTLMKEAAKRSPAVRDVGIHLTRQPANLRFLTVAGGGHIMGAFLNFAAPSLLAPMVQQGARHAQPEDPKVVERRQVTALVRGFAWVILWAPTTLTQAVLLDLFSGIDAVKVLALGILTSVLMITLGLGLDRLQWGKPSPPETAAQHDRPMRAYLTLAGICTLLVVGTYTLKFAAGLSVAEALLFAAPFTTVLWLLSQWPDHNRPHRLAKTSAIIASASPALVRSAIALGLSGYIGRASVYLLPIQDIASWMDAATISPFLFLAVLPVVITLGGQIALSPIIFVVFLGGVLTELPTYPADPTLTVFALGFGWALSMTAAPNATATLLLSAASGIAPTTLTWRWNGGYAALSYLVFLVLIFALTR